jgi:thioredoxin reductase (NADPH)
MPGGANSAGQAALNLAEYARAVTLVVRSNYLGERMSRFIEQRGDGWHEGAR